MDGATAAPAAALRRIEDLPGPRGLPFIGNALRLRKEQLHLLLERWAREHGPVYKWRMRGVDFVSVSDHKLVAAILRDRPQGFNRPARLAQISEEAGLEAGLFRANGKDWQRQRRMVMSGLDPTHVKAYIPSLEKVANRLLRRWEKAADERRPIDLQADLMRYTVDTVAGLAFGAEVNTLESDGEVIQDHLDKILPALRRRSLAPFPYWRVLRLPSDRQLERSVAEVRTAIRRFVAEARARLAADPDRRAKPPNLLEAMIIEADQGDSGLRDQDVAGNVLTMLLAGEDTTANSLAWMIDFLVRHPDALARVREEVSRWVPASGPLRFDPESQPSMRYLEACIHETMRLKPVAPFMPLEANRDTVIGGVEVPAGTVVFCLLRGDTVRDAWFPDAQAFNPERWLGDEDASSLGKHVSMPFGAGARICPGRYLALLEMKIAIAVFAGRFEVESLATPDGEPPAELLNFTMAPAGLEMRLRRAMSPIR
jgi:cytochrome P450